ncbi:MAG: ribulose-phosphate 3-epimerase [Anaerolineae bacterium]
MDPVIAPSILAANFAHLAADVQSAQQAGADWIHVDVMDGHFVPNISIGVPIVKALRGVTALPLDVHLMITNPDAYVEAFAKAGADHLTIHIEAASDPSHTLDRIRGLGCKAGIALNPGTPADSLADALPHSDLVIVMTVEPGFGGQAYMTDAAQKIPEIRQMPGGADVHISVDGGINAQTGQHSLRAGANVLVAGSAIFRSPAGIEAAIKQLKGLTTHDS